MSSSSPVSVDAITATFRNGYDSLTEKHNPYKAEERFARAAAQAEQLTGSKDNLITAYVKTFHWTAVYGMNPIPLSSEGRVALNKARHEEVVAVIASLQRRKAAGTLLRGTEVELAFYDACMSSHCSSTKLVSGTEALPGFVTFVMSASNILPYAVAGAATQGYAAALPSLAEAQQLFDFVADALDLIGQTVAPDGSPLLFIGPAGTVIEAFPCDAFLIHTISRYESIYSFVRGRYPQVISRFDEAWQRLSASPVFRVRNFAECVRDSTVAEEQHRTSHAEAVQRRVLRRCHLPMCGKEEFHPSQFKHCSGCSAAAIVYCCKEHQVADWPSHKAACKAARKGTGDGKKESGVKQK